MATKTEARRSFLSSMLGLLALPFLPAWKFPTKQVTQAASSSPQPTSRVIDVITSIGMEGTQMIATTVSLEIAADGRVRLLNDGFVDWIKEPIIRM